MKQFKRTIALLLTIIMVLGMLPLGVFAEPYKNSEANAQASPIIPSNAFKYNGHFYYIYNNCDSWEEAKSYCERLGGHLATISDEAENTALADYVSKEGGGLAYFGLSDVEEEGNFKWVTGEPLNFTAWASGEPTNSHGGEDYGFFTTQFPKYNWNDGNFGHGTSPDTKNFICEWDSDYVYAGDNYQIKILDSQTREPLDNVECSNFIFTNYSDSNGLAIVELNGTFSSCSLSKSGYVKKTISRDELNLYGITEILLDKKPEVIEVPDEDNYLVRRVREYTDTVTWESLNNALNYVENNKELSADQRVLVMNAKCQQLGFYNMEEGIKYLQNSFEQSHALAKLVYKRFLATEFTEWIHLPTPASTAARSGLYSSGLLLNAEIYDYITPSTYLTNQTPEVKKYKTMFYRLMQSKKNDIEIDSQKELASNVISALGIVTDLKKDQIDDIIQELMAEKNAKNLIISVKQAWGKIDPSWSQSLDLDISNCKGMKKTLGITSAGLSLAGFSADYLESLFNVLSASAVYSEFEDCLNEIAYSDNNLPAALKAAAAQVANECKNQSDGIANNTKNIVGSHLVQDGNSFVLDKVGLETLGGALSTLEAGRVISNWILDAGGLVNEEACVEGFAILGEYYASKVLNDKYTFNENQTTENAQKFYDDYNLLYLIRIQGEEAYLKMCDTKGILPAIKNFVAGKGETYEEKAWLVNETINEIKNTCEFNLKKESKNSIQYSKKVLIECPVDVEIYDSNNQLIQKISDGKTSDIENNQGRFASFYDSYNKDYNKVVYLKNNGNYSIKTKGNKAGHVKITTSEMSGSNYSELTSEEIPIVNNSVVSLDLTSKNVEIDKNGDGTVEERTTLSPVDSSGNTPVPNKVTINASVNPFGAGSVTGSGSYSIGYSVSLQAKANSGYRFINWTENGQVVSTNSNYSFTAQNNRTLTANFEKTSGEDNPGTQSKVPVYRLYNSGNNEHLYTSDLNEYNTLAGIGWTQEGIGWNAPVSGDPVYRLYSPVTLNHLFTTDLNEKNVLSSQGWQVDYNNQPLFYSGGSLPIYRLYHEGLRQHLLTKDTNEYSVLGNSGWNQEGIKLYGLTDSDVTPSNPSDSKVSVISISVNPKSLTLTVGDTDNITVNVYPSNATNRAVSWSSSNSNIVSVTNGKVVANKEGTATITAKSFDGGITDSCIVTVKAKSSSNNNVSVTGVTVRPNSLNLDAGKTAQLTATVLPNNATNKKVRWVSWNSYIASVDNSGLVTAKMPGTTTIEVLTDENSLSARCEITVNPSSSQIEPDLDKRIESITLYPGSSTLEVGETRLITPMYEPVGAVLYSTPKWTSLNPSIATVDQYGYIKGIAPGNAEVTLSCDGITATCYVTVKAKTIKPTNTHEVVFEKDNFSIKVGETIVVPYKVVPEAQYNSPGYSHSHGLKVIHKGDTFEITGEEPGKHHVSVQINISKSDGTTETIFGEVNFTVVK